PEEAEDGVFGDVPGGDHRRVDDPDGVGVELQDRIVGGHSSSSPSVSSPPSSITAVRSAKMRAERRKTSANVMPAARAASEAPSSIGAEPSGPPVDVPSRAGPGAGGRSAGRRLDGEEVTGAPEAGHDGLAGGGGGGGVVGSPDGHHGDAVAAFPTRRRHDPGELPGGRLLCHGGLLRRSDVPAARLVSLVIGGSYVR